MHQLQRVNGEVSSLGSLSFALVFGGMEFQRDVDENNSVSSGSLSPELVDVWRYSCPKSPDWDNDIDLLDRGRGSQRRRHEESATSLERALVGRALALSGSSGCLEDAHDGQQMEGSW